MEFIEILKRINALVFLVSTVSAVGLLIYLAIRYFVISKDIGESKKLLLSILAGLILLSVATFIPTLILSFLGKKIEPVNFPKSGKAPKILINDELGGAKGPQKQEKPAQAP